MPPSAAAEWFPYIMGACSTILILGSHVVYTAGRIDVKKTLDQLIDDRFTIAAR